MKRISLEEIIEKKQGLDYGQQYAYVIERIESGKIRPVKASGKNGKKPALYREYWIVEESNLDRKALLEELTFDMVPEISIDYYRAHLDCYQKERHWVQMLNWYLKNSKEKLGQPESINERSFEIWNREKFLLKENGKKIISHCGLEPELFHMYETTEPLAYYSHTRKTPQNLLILENKDTFFSMRRHLLEGGREIFAVSIGTLIYGGGKRIIRSFQDFDCCMEPYMRADGNQIYYFGDLDYEGIGIYESLVTAFEGQWEILPFIPAYQAMLKKARYVKELPGTKEQQNHNIRGSFFHWFDEETAVEMQKILEAEQYVPQEIINITDL
ncbi:MAG: hypothetical protein HFG49_11375 [Lachnospiraceae bacterium]|nr:hypothetical protein [Lachnospiraceae bacterium]